MDDLYSNDLAAIHDAAFGHIAEHAAAVLVKTLRASGFHRGTVVELGCGSGISSRAIRDAGFDVIGMDLSSALLARARQRVPDGVFRQESFVTAPLPACVGITAFGEVLNYTFDPDNTTTAWAGVFQRAFDALAPGGVFLCDLAGPARVPEHQPHRTYVDDENWVVLVEIEGDAEASSLTRRITTFTRSGEAYRRSRETHELRLADPEAIVSLMEDTGFSVQNATAYGPLHLPEGLYTYMGTKPRDACDGSAAM